MLSCGRLFTRDRRGPADNNSGARGSVGGARRGSPRRTRPIAEFGGRQTATSENGFGAVILTTGCVRMTGGDGGEFRAEFERYEEQCACTAAAGGIGAGVTDLVPIDKTPYSSNNYSNSGPQTASGVAAAIESELQSIIGPFRSEEQLEVGGLLSKSREKDAGDVTLTIAIESESMCNSTLTSREPFEVPNAASQTSNTI